MFTTTARYALVLALALGAMYFNGASARAEKCDTAIPERSGESLSSLSVGPPAAVGRMSNRSLTMGRTSVVRFRVTRYFMDPDGDNLTYTVSSSDATLATAEICGSVLKIVAKRNSRTATDVTFVRVTANDGTGAAMHSFCVSVGGNCSSPPSSGPVTDLMASITGDNLTSIVSGTEYTWGSRVTDGTPPYTYSWHYATNCGHEVRAAVGRCEWQWTGAGSGSSYTQTITATAVSARIRLIVRDSATPADSVTKYLSLTITQPEGTNPPPPANLPPVVDREIAAQTLTAGSSAATFDLNNYFSDPEGGGLTYRASLVLTGIAQVSISGSTLTLTPVSAGTDTVTVTATDQGGLNVAQKFAVTVTGTDPPPNLPPVVDREIAAQTLTAGSSAATFDLNNYFSDPEGGGLTYRASLVLTGIAQVSISGSTLTLTPVSAGKDTVTVTATDQGGLNVAQKFVVTVTGQAPLAVEIAGPASIASGAENTWQAQASGGTSPYTYRWDYATECADDNVPGRTSDSCVWKWIDAGSGPGLTRTITTPDTLAAVRVTATDRTSSSVRKSLDVSVNHAPGVVGTISARTIVLGHPDVSFSVARFFSDPDPNDVLTYAASSSSDDTVGVSMSGSMLTLKAKKVNTTPDTVSVTATDPEGLISPAQKFAVTVEDPPDLTVSITGGNLTSIVSGTEYTWGSTVTGGTSPYTYSWSHATRCIDGALIADEPCEWQWTGAGSGSSYTKTITTTARSAQIRLIVSDSSTPADSVTKHLSLRVTQPPPGLGTVGTISNRTLTEGGSSSSFGVSSYFRKPNADDVLTYSVSSSNTSRVTASMSGATLTIRPVAAGTATITVTATLDGTSAKQRFSVTVNSSTVTPPPVTPPPPVNRSPVAVGTISNRTLTLVTAPSASFGVASSFSDPDPNDTLTYTVSSSNTSRVTASMSGSTLTITAVSQGTATVTVTATDPGNLSATQQFTVTVPNRPPVVSKDIPDQTLTAGGSSATFDLDSYFSDPDGDNLTYSTWSNATSVATASRSGSTLTITPVSAGNTTVNVNAGDGSISALQSVGVTVSTAAGLSASISGPSSITTVGRNTWTASARGGSSPYTYSWRYKVPCSGEAGEPPEGAAAPPCMEWTSGGTSSSLTLTLSSSTTIELTATDDDGDSVTVTLSVSVYISDLDL